jgi:hypothetical protein
MRTAHRLSLLLLCLAWPALAALVAPGPGSGLQPAWRAGDWWAVSSRLYDHGERRPGALAGWLPVETWIFSVVSTNALEGEACYQLAVKPGAQNRCPYRFGFWLRQSDLVVLRRELYQPAIRKGGRAGAPAVVRTDYPKDEAMPFVPADFPGLPFTVPHFGAGLTNQYAGKAARGLRQGSRCPAGPVSQVLAPDEPLPPQAPAVRAGATGGKGRGGCFTLASSPETFERQNWSAGLPWHAYAEKTEHGEVVRQSWLSDRGDAASAPAGGVR